MEAKALKNWVIVVVAMVTGFLISAPDNVEGALGIELYPSNAAFIIAKFSIIFLISI